MTTVKNDPWVVATVVVGVLAAAGLAIHSFDAMPPSAMPTTESQLTADESFTGDPALSPDGKRIVYASDRAELGKIDLWVQPVEGAGEPLRLTQDPGDNAEPSFSPDGKQIVFHSARDGGGVYLISSDGGPSERIADDGHHPVFSPDSRYVAFEVSPQQGRASIHVLDRESGQTSELQKDFAIMLDPRWSPDGQRIAFAGTKSTSDRAPMDLWISPREPGVAIDIGLSGAMQHWAIARAVHDAFGVVREGFFPIAWIPDGILAVSNDSVWKAAVSPESWKIQGKPVRVAAGVYGSDPTRFTGRGSFSIVASGGGRLLAVARRSEVERIWSMSLDHLNPGAEGDLKRLTAGHHDRSPRVSADGSVLLFIAGQVHQLDRDTGKATALTSGSARPGGLAVSMDGRTFTYVDYDSGSPDAYQGFGKGYYAQVTDPKGSRFCEMCSGSLDISADGKQVLFSSQTNIEIYDVPSGQTRVLFSATDSKVSRVDVKFSPAGDWIAFLAQDMSDKLGLYVAPLSGGRPVSKDSWVTLVDDSYQVGRLAWSPDGTSVYFVSSKDGFPCLWVQSLIADSKQPVAAAVPVRHFHDQARRLEPDFAVARSQAVFLLREKRSNIWLVRPAY